MSHTYFSHLIKVKVYLNNLSEIMTKQGILRVDRLVPNIPVLNAEGEMTFIKSIKPIENLKVYHLGLKNGASISIGENTLVRTQEGLKKIQDVVVDDFVAYSFGIIKNSKRDKPIIWKDENHVNALPIKIPKSMSEDLCLWLGIIASKGRYNQDINRIVVSFMDKKLQKLFSDLTFKIFKLLPSEYIDERCNLLTPTIHSPNLVRFLIYSFGANSALKKVPSFILEGSLQDQLSFIRGLTLDGYIDQGQLVVYGGVSKRIADFVAMVLRNCGYAVHQQIRKSGNGNNSYYTKITGKTDFALKFEPLEPEKTKGLHTGGYFVALTEEMIKTPIPTSHPNYSAIRNIRYRKAKVCYNHTLDGLDIPYTQEFHYVEVKSIKVQNQDGFEIQTENDDGLVFQGLSLGKVPVKNNI